jgi:hypothetical protein
VGTAAAERAGSHLEAVFSGRGLRLLLRRLLVVAKAAVGAVDSCRLLRGCREITKVSSSQH